MLGVSLSTLKRWERAGLFTPGRFQNGTKFYTTAHLETCLGHGQSDDSYRVFLAHRIRFHTATGLSSQAALAQVNVEWRDRKPADTVERVEIGTKKKAERGADVSEAAATLLPTPNPQLPTP
jgi:hypothetical protein